jgi:hypothetical protein
MIHQEWSKFLPKMQEFNISIHKICHLGKWCCNEIFTPSQCELLYDLDRSKCFNPQKLVYGQFDCHIPEDLTIREGSKLVDEHKQDLPIARPNS